MNATYIEDKSFISFKIWLMSVYTICLGLLGAYTHYKYREYKYSKKKVSIKINE